MVDGDALPVDVLRSIFELLPTNSVCRAGAVCHLWRSTADEFITKVDIHLSPTDPLKIQQSSFPLWLDRHAHNLQHLALRGGNSRSLSCELLGILGNSTRLTYLDLRSMVVGLSKADCALLPPSLHYLSTKLATPLHVEWPLGHLTALRVALLEITDRSLDARRPTMEVTGAIASNTALQTLVLDGEVVVSAPPHHLACLTALSTLAIHGNIYQTSLSKFGACPGLARLMLVSPRAPPTTWPALPGIARLLLAMPHNVAIGIPSFAAFPHLRQLMAANYHVGGPSLAGIGEPGELPELQDAIIACNEAHVFSPLPTSLRRVQFRCWAPRIYVSLSTLRGLHDLELLYMAARAEVVLMEPWWLAGEISPSLKLIANPDIDTCNRERLVEELGLEVRGKCDVGVRFATDESWFTDLATVCHMDDWWESLWPHLGDAGA